MKRVVVIGAGPAGLTAAYELAVNNDLYFDNMDLFLIKMKIWDIF